jgi:cytochrome o ubiquinol oxidase subunit IV
MSDLVHNTGSEPKHEHGSVKSYVVGFILSLVFTFIPFYMVVNQTVTGVWLLGTILGFGVLQAIVQLVFFLHLGRKPVPYWQVGFLIATVGAIFVVVVGSIWIMHHLHYNMTPKNVTDKISDGEAIHQISGKQTGTCDGEPRTAHKIELRNDKPSVRHIQGRLCDALTIINHDKVERAIYFGTLEEHASYAGETGMVIRPGRNKTFVFTELGTHKFHDHAEANITGDFTVAP